jgi:hypothetical protein
MNSLKSNLPIIEIKTNDYLKKSKKKKNEKITKFKYLDNLLSDDFIKNYFLKDKKLNKN